MGIRCIYPSATRLSHWDPWLSVPRLLVVWLYRLSLFKKIVLSQLPAISMPMDLCRHNPLIAKRIINRSNLNGIKGSDTSCYGEIGIWHRPSMTGTANVQGILHQQRRSAVFTSSFPLPSLRPSKGGPRQRTGKLFRQRLDLLNRRYETRELQRGFLC